MASSYAQMAKKALGKNSFVNQAKESGSSLKEKMKESDSSLKEKQMITHLEHVLLTEAFTFAQTLNKLPRPLSFSLVRYHIDHELGTCDAIFLSRNPLYSPFRIILRETSCAQYPSCAAWTTSIIENQTVIVHGPGKKFYFCIESDWILISWSLMTQERNSISLLEEMARSWWMERLCGSKKKNFILHTLVFWESIVLVNPRFFFVWTWIRASCHLIMLCMRWKKKRNRIWEKFWSSSECI